MVHKHSTPEKNCDHRSKVQKQMTPDTNHERFICALDPKKCDASPVHHLEIDITSKSNRQSLKSCIAQHSNSKRCDFGKESCMSQNSVASMKNNNTLERKLAALNHINDVIDVVRGCYMEHKLKQQCEVRDQPKQKHNSKVYQLNEFIERLVAIQKATPSCPRQKVPGTKSGRDSKVFQLNELIERLVAIRNGMIAKQSKNTHCEDEGFDETCVESQEKQDDFDKDEGYSAYQNKTCQNTTQSRTFSITEDFVEHDCSDEEDYSAYQNKTGQNTTQSRTFNITEEFVEDVCSDDENYSINQNSSQREDQYLDFAPQFYGSRIDENDGSNCLGDNSDHNTSQCGSGYATFEYECGNTKFEDNSQYLPSYASFEYGCDNTEVEDDWEAEIVIPNSDCAEGTLYLNHEQEQEDFECSNYPIAWASKCEEENGDNESEDIQFFTAREDFVTDLRENCEEGAGNVSRFFTIHEGFDFNNCSEEEQGVNGGERSKRISNIC